MKKIGTITASILLLTGVAFAEEQTLQSHEKVQEKSLHSTVVDSDATEQPVKEKHDSVKVETHKKSTTTTNSDPAAEDTTTQSDIKVEKKSSTTLTPQGGEPTNADRTTRRSVRSELHSEHTSEKEVRE